MWYYELNQAPFGPVSKETIADELKVGKISAQTRVWREGWAEWRRLGETELGLLIVPSPSSAGSGSAAAPPPVYVNPPVYMSLPQYKKVDPNSLTKLFWWWFGLMMFVVPIFIASLIFADQPWVIGLICAFEIPLFAGAVLQYILIYKFWQVIQDGFARTSPGKAVGFLFIPFFNFYWMYVAYHGLAKDMNAYIDRHFSSNFISNLRKTKPVLSLIYMIMLWAYLLFYFVLLVLMIAQVFTTLASPADLSGMMQPYILGISIYAVVQMALMFVIYFDFHRTAISILGEEIKTR